MNRLNVCIGLYCSGHPLCQAPEETYVSIYRKLVSYLYANPTVPFTLFFSGPQLEWFEKNHSEFIDILKELIERKQIEILGGGYYDPVFPFILPVDRVGQIEFLTTCLRKTVGRRPRGALLAGSVWDPSLISSLTTCGMEFVMLDSQYTNLPCRPLIVEDMGKSLQVLPYNSMLSSEIEEEPQELLEKMRKSAKNIENPFVCCLFDMQAVFDKGRPEWFFSLFELIAADTAMEMTLPSRYIKTVSDLKKAYLVTGAAPAVLHRFSGAGFAHKNSVRNYLIEFPEALLLYSKMMYISLLVNQCRGDRARKKAAREELWQAQNCNAYWFLGSDGVTNQRLRQQNYRHLLNAEKMVRSAGAFIPSVASFDFDMDGLNEYLFQFESYNFGVRLNGGSIFEFDSLVTQRNYADTMQRTKEFDLLYDAYPRKMFMDHFIAESDLNRLKTGVLDGLDTTFPTLRYQELSFDRTKREVQFKVSAKFHAQEISLKKKYMASAGGVQVQYILKNESPTVLSGCLAVECNLAFQGCSADQQKIEAVIDSSLHEIDPSQPACFLSGSAYVELTDLCSPISFMYETNEDSGFFLYPLTITRPVQGKLTELYQATTCTFFWHVEVPPGREIEKMIQLSIKTRRKTKRPSLT